MEKDHRGKFIVIHGIDGTGKTTTAESVSKGLREKGFPVINYDIHKNLTGKDNPHSRKKVEVDKTGTLETRLATYLASMMYHSEQIDVLLAQGFHVVKSRYLDDICAHFAHLGVNSQDMGILKKKFPMIQPDLKVILQLDEDIRRERINKRGILDDRDEDKKEHGSRLQFFEDYLRQAATNASVGSILHIDTGAFDSDEVAKQIIDKVISGLHT